jgi:cytochrome c peroxidase
VTGIFLKKPSDGRVGSLAVQDVRGAYRPIGESRDSSPEPIPLSEELCDAPGRPGGPLARGGGSVMRYQGRCVGIALGLALVGAILTTSSVRGQDGGGPRGPVFTVANESGRARTINVAGFPVVAPDNPFFRDLGLNGRRCVTCHQPENNMSVSARGIQARFEATGGTDPIFRTNDGANSPLADVSTREARGRAYSMLLTKGLIRVGISIPANAEFELVAVRDPYGYAGNNRDRELSLFRRPLPATNLAFLSTVMWDGRETIERGSPSAIHFDLSHQSNSATQGHAQAPNPLDDVTRDEMVEYEMGNFTAQIFDRAAGHLHTAGAQGGPERLSRRSFVFGDNDPLGCDASGVNCAGSNPAFDPIVFTEYDAWARLIGGGRNRARGAVARGQALFNTVVIPIAGVSGVNDDFGGPGNFDVPIVGTCTTCHDTPNAGDHSVPAPLDIGVADPPVSVAQGGDGVHNRFGLPVGDMPVYTLRNKTTREIKIVTDPGRALITGKWKDVGRFKGPILRGLAGRAPYFHNGAAATLRDAVDFYDRRFNLALSDTQKSDLVAFLRSL